MANSANKFRTTHLKIWRDNLTVQRMLLINHYMYSTGKLFSSRTLHWWILQALTYLYLSLYCWASSPYRFWESFFNFWRVSFFSYNHKNIISPIPFKIMCNTEYLISPEYFIIDRGCRQHDLNSSWTFSFVLK